MSRQRTLENLEKIRDYLGQDFNQSDISDLLGLTRERIRQLIHSKLELYLLYEQKRKQKNEQKREEKIKQKGEANELMSTREQIAGYMCQAALRQAPDLAHKYALKYWFGNSKRATPTAVPFDQLLRLFTAYFNARDAKETKSYERLGKESEISTMTSGKILRSTGLTSLVFSLHRTTRKERERIRQALYASELLPFSDIAQFLGFSDFSVNWVAKQHGIHKRSYLCHSRGRKVTYSKAMDFYDAIDAGFPVDEAMEYAGIYTKRALLILLGDRAEIEGEIKRFKAAMKIF